MMGMMNDDKKKMATLILGFGKGDKKPDESMGEEKSEPTGSTASDVLKAIKSGDEKAFKGALKAFVYECMNEGEDSDEEESEY